MTAVIHTPPFPSFEEGESDNASGSASALLQALDFGVSEFKIN